MLYLPCPSQNFNGEKVLWLGTSIPEGCTYPVNACKALNMTCINKSIGSSYLSINKNATGENYWDGLSLVMSKDEKRELASKNNIEEGLLNRWINSSYEVVVDPFINQVDIVVIDHGYNDDFTLSNEYQTPVEDIDWNNMDRTTFIGAFNFLYNRIKAKNPNVKVVIGGYFQNTCTIGYFIRGIYVSNVLTKIAKHYNLPLFDIWNYVNIPDGYIPNSSDYLNQLNNKYNTNFTKVFPDSLGNITYFQKFCPDGVHPFSDPTGNSDRILDSVFTKVLYERLSSSTNVISLRESKNMKEIWYDLQGRKINSAPKTGIYIRKDDKGKRSKVIFK